VASDGTATVIRFVTGTDTGVGKTVAAAALCRAERQAGKTVLYAKPVQTGLDPGEPGDAAFVAAAALVPVVECLRFPDPLAPAVAAERVGAVIDVDALLADLAKAGDGFDRIVVEGAGGLLVPLWGDVTMADLADRLGAGLDGSQRLLLERALAPIPHLDGIERRVEDGGRRAPERFHAVADARREVVERAPVVQVGDVHRMPGLPELVRERDDPRGPPLCVVEHQHLGHVSPLSATSTSSTSARSGRVFHVRYVRRPVRLGLAVILPQTTDILSRAAPRTGPDA